MFLETIEAGPLDSAYAQMKGRMIIEHSLDLSFPLRLAAKDARLVLEAASAEGDEPALALAIERRLTHANEFGHGDKDMAAVYRAAIGEPAVDR